MKAFGTRIGGWRRMAWCLALSLIGWAGPARAAVLVLEDFDPDEDGWFSRDGELTVASDPFGNVTLSLRGDFAAQDVPAFESDAFRAAIGSSSGDFVGDYSAGPRASFTAFIFDFYSEDVLPSSMLLRIGDGTHTFVYSTLSQLTTTGNWTTVTVPLQFSGSWAGGTGTQFSNVFTGVTFVDVQFARSGTGGQSYFLDNFTLSDDQPEGGGGEGSSVVPEAGSFGMIALGLVFLWAMRRRIVELNDAAWVSVSSRPEPEDQFDFRPPALNTTSIYSIPLR